MRLVKVLSVHVFVFLHVLQNYYVPVFTGDRELMTVFLHSAKYQTQGLTEHDAQLSAPEPTVMSETP